MDTRYVRLTVPSTAQRGTTCIKEFEVYESGALVGIESIDDTADLVEFAHLAESCIPRN